MPEFSARSHNTPGFTRPARGILTSDLKIQQKVEQRKKREREEGKERKRIRVIRVIREGRSGKSMAERADGIEIRFPSFERARYDEEIGPRQIHPVTDLIRQSPRYIFPSALFLEMTTRLALSLEPYAHGTLIYIYSLKTVGIF